MSLGSACRACDVEFSSRGARGWFAQPTAALRPGHWRMFPDILRFYRDARARLDDGAPSPADPRRLPRRDGLRRGVPRPLPRPDHVRGVVDVRGRDPRLPARLPAALPRPSRADRGRAGAPVADDHGRLDGLRGADRGPDRAGCGAGRRPGGRCRAERGRRSSSGPPAARRDTFDAVVMATHADDALAVLRDADPRERRALAGFEYTTNRVVLHTDERLLPRRPAARGSWNVDQADCRHPADQLAMTYDMNRLQSLPGPDPVVRVGQPGRPPGPGADRGGPPDAPPELHLRDARRAGGRRRSSRAGGGPGTPGAHLGYGFHEDGCRSGFEAAAALVASASAEERAA